MSRSEIVAAITVGGSGRWGPCCAAAGREGPGGGSQVGPVSLETWCLGVRRFRHIPLWETGGVKFETVFEGLRRIGYAGCVTVHQAFAELMGPEEAAAKSGSYLRGVGEFEPVVPS